MPFQKQPTAILLMGPTASGKTQLGIALAHALNAEIISVDSALVYRDMDIGTAKPGMAEREGIVHHLIDILDPSESFSTGEFRTQALGLMADIQSRGKLPLLVGGTMLYFNTLTHGLAQLPEASPEIRLRLDQELLLDGKEKLHARLSAIDPQAAARIHVNDPQRIQRALEVYELSGRPLSSFFQPDQTADHPFNLLKLIIAPAERHTLHTKIAERFKAMLQQGLLEEVERLQQRADLHENLPAMRCVGYRQAWAYLKGEYGFNEMQDKAIAATRQLAKRQFTWLRKEQNALQLVSGETNILDTAREYCLQHG